MAHRNPWMRLYLDTWTLGVESTAVMGLRTMKIAAGGRAGEAEAHRMFSEKFDAGLALQAKAMTGALGLTAPAMAAGTLSHYRRRVRANHRRLIKG